MASYEVVRPANGGQLPLIIHLPYGSPEVPPWVRATLVLDDRELDAELRAVTDRGFEDMLAPGRELGAILLIGRTSRLVCDPVRCLPAAVAEATGTDAAAPERQAPPGAVPLRTPSGAVLRRPDFTAAAREAILRDFGWPHADALARLVAAEVAACGACWVLTVRGYTSDRTPDGRPPPQVCLGRDPFHEPEGWASIWRGLAHNLNFTVADNDPLRPTPLPATLQDRDPRVRALTLGLRRDLLGDETRDRPTESHLLIMREFMREGLERCKGPILEELRR